MRRILAILITLTCTGVIYAQDTFNDVKETLGKSIYITNGDISPCTYIMMDEKIKLVKKDKKNVYTINGVSYKVDSEEYQYKKDMYIVLKGNGNIFFLKESDAPIYLSYLRNEFYWNDYVRQLNENYPYLDISEGKMYHSGGSKTCYDGLSRITWGGFFWSNDNIVVRLAEDSSGKMSSIKPDQIVSLKDKAFINKDNIGSYVKATEMRLAKEKRDQEIRDSLHNRKLRLATVQEECTYGVGDDELTLHVGDTVAIYMYNDSVNRFVGRYRFRNLRFSDEDIRFADSKDISTSSYSHTWVSEDKNYLKFKGYEDVDQRFDVAFEYDSITTAAFVADLRARIKAYNAERNYMASHQIFITKAGYNYDDEQFGMDYDIYNCFNKTIKYVSIRLACYNVVGDPQADYFGRYTSTVRGIGPIEPGQCGSYSWEKIFWDENNVIENCYITSITFTFKDKTTKSFSGIGNIKKHFANNAWNKDDE